MASIHLTLQRPRRQNHSLRPRVRNLRAEALAALEYVRLKDQGRQTAIIACPDPIREWRAAITPEPNAGGRIFKLTCESRVPHNAAAALSEKLSELNCNEIDFGNDRHGFQIMWHEPAEGNAVQVAA